MSPSVKVEFSAAMSVFFTETITRKMKVKNCNKPVLSPKKIGGLFLNTAINDTILLDVDLLLLYSISGSDHGLRDSC